MTWFNHVAHLVWTDLILISWELCHSKRFQNVSLWEKLKCDVVIMRFGHYESWRQSLAAHPGSLQSTASQCCLLNSFMFFFFFLFFYWAALCFKFLRILSPSWIRSTMIQWTCFEEMIRNEGGRCLKRKSCERIRKNRESREAPKEINQQQRNTAVVAQSHFQANISGNGCINHLPMQICESGNHRGDRF